MMCFFACQQPGKNSTGSEYFSDMGHSVAYEANYFSYYYYNTWGSKDDYHKMAQPRVPVTGTIARGYAGDMAPSDSYSSNEMAHSPNGSVPYYYENTEEERTRAMSEIINNPFHITDDGLAEGKELYDIYCGICHGDKGDGGGYLAREDGGKLPVVPANLLLDEFVAASNGRYYHAIMYGKNMMGNYDGKLSYEERWQVIHYIRSLQASNAGLEYNQYANTLNTIDVPAGDIVVEDTEPMNGEHTTDEDSDHSDSDDHGQESEH